MQLRQSELACAQIGIREAKNVTIGENRAEIIRAFRFEQIEVAHCTRADDLGDIARDDFAGLRFAGLIADRDAPAGLDELGNVVLAPRDTERRTSARRCVWSARR